MTRKELKELVIHYMGGNISCKEFTEVVTDYLEGSQTFFERIQFQMHWLSQLLATNEAHDCDLGQTSLRSNLTTDSRRTHPALSKLEEKSVKSTENI